MALAIKAIPTLHGEQARLFEQEAELVEENPGTLDYTEEARLVREYLHQMNLLWPYLIPEERLEAKYMGIGVSHLPLNTRLMYFDLLEIKPDVED